MPDRQPTPTTKAEMREALDFLGIAAPAVATRAELWALYEAALRDLDSIEQPEHDPAPDPADVPSLPAVAALPPGPADDTPPVGPIEQAFGAWDAITAMSQSLARSNLVKPALRGRPDDIALTLLVGRDLGLAPTMALAKIHVIDGLPTLSAEAMAALIRGRGHRLTGEVAADEHGHPVKAVVTGTRGDTGETMTAEYRIEDAVAAGLCSIDPSTPTGVRARNSNGKAQAWEKFTSDMLWARCVSRIGRRLFADVLVGVSYTPEELGYVENEVEQHQQHDPDAEFVENGWTSRAESASAHTTLGPLVKQLPSPLRDGVKATHGWPIVQRDAFGIVAHAAAQVLADDGSLTHAEGVAAFGETAWTNHCRERVEDAQVVEPIEPVPAAHVPDDPDGIVVQNAVVVPLVQAEPTVDTADPTGACATCGSLDPCECPF